MQLPPSKDGVLGAGASIAVPGQKCAVTKPESVCGKIKTPHQTQHKHEVSASWLLP